MAVIEIPDEQAAALAEKAAAQGLTLTEWLQTLASPEAPGQKLSSVQDAVARILELQQHVKPDPEGWTVKDYINYSRP